MCATAALFPLHTVHVAYFVPVRHSTGHRGCPHFQAVLLCTNTPSCPLHGPAEFSVPTHLSL